MNKDFVCELCTDIICANEPHIRVGVDAAMQTDDGRYTSLMNSEVMVFATFHVECVRATAKRADCDVLDYIQEARSLVSSVKVFDVDQHKIKLTARRSELN